MAATAPEIVRRPVRFPSRRSGWRRPGPWCGTPGAAVWAIDGDALVVRPGPRLVDGVEAIAAILHPGAVAAPPAGAIRRIS